MREWTNFFMTHTQLAYHNKIKSLQSYGKGWINYFSFWKSCLKVLLSSRRDRACCLAQLSSCNAWHFLFYQFQKSKTSQQLKPLPAGVLEQLSQEIPKTVLKKPEKLKKGKITKKEKLRKGLFYNFTSYSHQN